MATPVIFIAFANSAKEPLPSLKKEDDGVYESLAKRRTMGHFSIHRDSATTLENIAKYLVLYRHDLEVFLYSGHAERDTLFLEDKEANALGIAALLGQCSKLKLVVLNGCSTKGQVEELLKLETSPVVIATSAPVGDESATMFSTTFFKLLCDDFSSIGEAFKPGIAAAQTATKQKIEAQESRGKVSFGTKKASKEPLWGIYSKGEIPLEWKLPTEPQYTSSQDYLPNVNLIYELAKAIQVHSPEVKSKFSALKGEWELPSDISEDDTKSGPFIHAKNSILQSLPHPISEQLRKLMVEQQAGSDHKFYDKLGSDRLKQISSTYSTVIELFAYIFLSQLWEEISSGKVKKIKDEAKTLIHQFFLADKDGFVAYTFPDLISSILDVFRENKIECFIDELNPIDKMPLKEDSTFVSAWHFMETLEDKIYKLGNADMEKAEADQLCMIAEEKLGNILSKLSFIVNYQMFSVQNIDAIKYRNDENPQFQHKLIRFQQMFTELAIEKKTESSCMDTASILLINTKNEKKGFLSLSPFIIDENAFDDKSPLAKLRYFSRYEKPMDAYTFKHVYKPDDSALVIQTQKQFKIVRKQFDDFSTAIFKKSFQDL